MSARIASALDPVGAMHLSALNALVTRFIFRFGLLKAAYTREQLQQMSADSRFGGCEISVSGIGLEVALARR